MKKRLVTVVMAVAIVLAIPVAAFAAEDEDAPSTRPPIDLEERFETVDEAIAAITERMTSVLDRVTEKYEELQDNADVPEEVFEHIAAAIDRIEETVAAVNGADDFDELSSILQEAREQRRAARADRPYRPRPGFLRGEREAAETTS